jgi:SAM-dependent methyltransferase
VTEERSIPGVDTTTPSVARIYDAMLGGKDNFEVDRSARDELIRTAPDAPEMLQSNRRWLQRVVRWLAGQAGIDQFLDVGSGLPTAENTHEVAQSANHDARCVYVDNDPTAIAFGQALLADNDRTFFVAGDLTRPAELLADPAVADHLDLDRPLALLQCATLHFVPPQAAAEQIMRDYVERLAPGSYVGITHARNPNPDDDDHDTIVTGNSKFATFAPSFTPRTVDQIEALFDGLEVVPPGVVPLGEWWPTGPRLGPPAPRAKGFYGGVGRKP